MAHSFISSGISEVVFVTASLPMMYGSALLSLKKEGWLALSDNGHFRPSTTRALPTVRSTPVELICGDVVPQHY
jgi:hypothetical protein